jgi:O-antigen/teichoic acid export membrane protein
VSGDGPGLHTKVARGVAWAAGAQAVIAVADLVSQMLVIALWIPTNDLGIAFAAIPFYTALDYIADLGVSSALIQRDDHTPERVSTVFWFNVLVSTGLFLVLCGLGPLYGWIQGHAVIGWLLVAYGGKLLLQNAYAIPVALLKKELRFSDLSKARVVAHLAESVGRVVLAASGFTIWCWTLAALIRALVFGIIIQLRHPFWPRLVFRFGDVIPYVKFGLRSASSQVLYQLYTSMDAPIIFHMFGEHAAGIYALADSIVLEPVKTIANVVIDVAFPTFARLRNEGHGLIEQFIKFTRLNLIAVLPFVGLILLVIPDFLLAFYSHGKWKHGDLVLCAEAARILCVMGLFRALGFLGPPLLDGVGKPELTLRYMVVATACVPASFWLAAVLLGPSIGFLSVAVAWAIGYPIAFAVLSYLVVKTIELPIRAYLAGSWGIIASCGLGIAIGFAVSAMLPAAAHGIRMIAVGGSSLVVTATLLATWQKITPRSVGAALKA